MLVAVALQLTFLLQSVLATAGFLFFYIAIVIAAWFGGAWAGGLTVLLSIAALEYYFVPPIHSFHVSPESLPVFIEFAVSAAVVGWFSSWRRRAENQLQQARLTPGKESKSGQPNFGKRTNSYWLRLPSVSERRMPITKRRPNWVELRRGSARWGIWLQASLTR